MKDLTNEELPMLLEQPFCIAFSITLPYLLFTAKVSGALRAHFAALQSKAS